MKSAILQPFSLSRSKLQKLSFAISWVITVVVVSGLIWFAWLQLFGVQTVTGTVNREIERTMLAKEALPEVGLPGFVVDTEFDGIRRMAILQTVVQEEKHLNAITYTVMKGDSIFKISKQFNIKPETILWANPETFNDNPELLSIGMVLNIPLSDGIYYRWKSGDTIPDVAVRFRVDPDAILLWPENGLDIIDPEVSPDTYVMIPGGTREMVSWVMPTIPRGKAGVSKTLAGPGACDTTDGAYGTGTFVWPAVNNYLSGNDYWSGHLALDIASNMGSPVFASDSGLVVYAGWNNTGYGNMVMIDHGNGYQTLYAHMSQASVSSGSSVYQGSAIGSSGSSGNSTGPHLHFETRYLGGLVNPWSLMQ